MKHIVSPHLRYLQEVPLILPFSFGSASFASPEKKLYATYNFVFLSRYITPVLILQNQFVISMHSPHDRTNQDIQPCFVCKCKRTTLAIIGYSFLMRYILYKSYFFLCLLAFFQLIHQFHCPDNMHYYSFL